MKYFVCAYNYLTLHKALVYARKVWGIDNTYFLFCESVCDAPRALQIGKYKNIVENPGKYEKKIKIKGMSIINFISANKRIVNRFVDYIRKQEYDLNAPITLVVFKDTDLRESILIEKIKAKYINAKVIMIEEGLAVYSNGNAISDAMSTKKKDLLFLMMGIPKRSIIYNLPFGCNKLTDQIICSRPKEIEETRPDKKGCIIKQIDVFHREDCEYFITEVLMQDIDQTNIDYVFLSQPIFPVKDETINNKYHGFLIRLFSILGQNGKILIKPHPLDTWDYKQYESYNITLCPAELSKLAYELLDGFYGHPTAITLYSSAAYNVTNAKSRVFLYDFFPEIINPNIFNDDFFAKNNIIRCKEFSELKKLVEK